MGIQEGQFDLHERRKKSMVIQTGDVEGGIRILTLNRPPANAINRELLEELHEACREAERAESVRALVVTGSGRFFSGGLDLKEIASQAGRDVSEMGLGSKDGIFALWTLPKPTIAMVNGHAIAGGAILMMACDFRITGRGHHKIGLNEVAIGLAIPTGGFEIAHLALANKPARRAMLMAELHEPEVALQLGLVDEVTDSVELERACMDRAQRLASFPRGAYAHMKRALQMKAVERVLGETEEQRKALREVWTSQETMQALLTQFSKLSPKGGGRGE